MPVYNCALYIRESLESILNQSYKDFQLLIIDDASTDQTVSIIKSYSDCRIRLIEKPANTGYTNSLNLGLQQAKGEYIARMDGDDISALNRFELQVQAFERNPALVLCGSNIEFIDSNEIRKFPLSHDEIKVTFLTYSCIAHPSVMMKRSFLVSQHMHYNNLREPAEDFDLWVRMIQKGELMNLEEPLLRYRVHADQTSQTKYEIQQKNGLIIRILYLSNIVDKEVAEKFFQGLKVAQSGDTGEELAYLNWLIKENDYLRKKNREKEFFNELLFNDFLNAYNTQVARGIFLNSKKYNLRKLAYFVSYLSKNPGKFRAGEILKCASKCLLGYRIK